MRIKRVDQKEALWRTTAVGETSRTAAKVAGEKAPPIRNRILALLSDKPMISEELVAAIKAAGGITTLSGVRGRCSELVRMGLIVDSKTRRPGEGGCPAIAWRLASEAECAAYRALHDGSTGRGEA